MWWLRRHGQAAPHTPLAVEGVTHAAVGARNGLTRVVCLPLAPLRRFGNRAAHSPHLSRHRARSVVAGSTARCQEKHGMRAYERDDRRFRAGGGRFVFSSLFLTHAVDLLMCINS